jgi:outer membrane protein OmpA-like peptidoglycan-associated protein
MRRTLIAVSLLACAGVGTSACATKGFVKTEVSQVGAKVDTLGQSLENTQERTKQNETKIADVDVKAAAAQTAAAQAGTAATTAATSATAANTAAVAAGTKADDVAKASKRIVYEAVLSEAEGNFTRGGSELPVATRAKLDEMVTALKADPKGAYFEIEGHTDNSGNPASNERLGLARAESVKRYLYVTHQIPLHRMNVISYGETKPASDNKTRAGRAENRRIVIRVMA